MQICLQRGALPGSHRVSRWYSPDPDKLRAVSAFPVPNNEKQLREFLEQLLPKICEELLTDCWALYRLTKKNTKGFQWDPACQQAFDDLKQQLTSPPILTYPVFTLLFIVHTDASERAIGGVLSQVQEGEERVIAYWSRQLNRQNVITPLLRGKP